jgi:hypothetical protein
LPYTDKSGTNLLLFKFHIQLHANEDLKISVAGLWGKNGDADAQAHMTYQAPITG